jgi:putative tryptophan/tyrosine transport system substrate-binding protein
MVYVDRILRGARPADLPVELPSRQELAVNLRPGGRIAFSRDPAFDGAVAERSASMRND